MPIVDIGFLIFKTLLAQNRVERGAGAEGGVGFCLVREVVAADVGGLALDGEEFGDDGFLVFREGGGEGGEGGLEGEVGVLFGERLGPVEGEVEMGAAVVDRAELAAGRAVVFEEKAGGGIEGFGEDFCLGVAFCVREVLEGGGEGEELAE